MLLYNNLCLSSFANATFAIFLLSCFYSISNNTYPLSVKVFLSNSTAFVIAHRSFTSALSNVAVPIACDTFNAQAVAVREYHYLTAQVMAVKEDKSFIWTQISFARFCRGKVMASLFPRLAVCQRYWIALFSCQRTRKKKIIPISLLSVRQNSIC